jgi:hypothetical protein
MFLDKRIKNNNDVFSNLTWYDEKSLNYNRLPSDRELVFKQDGPKRK